MPRVLAELIDERLLVGSQRNLVEGLAHEVHVRDLGRILGHAAWAAAAASPSVLLPHAVSASAPANEPDAITSKKLSWLPPLLWFDDHSDAAHGETWRSHGELWTRDNGHPQKAQWFLNSC